MILINIDQGSEAWFEVKAGKVTGTRFKALVAGEGTQTYKDLVSNIACEMITGRMEETYSNSAMEYGIETEDVARLEYQSLLQIPVIQCGFIQPDEDHKFFEWIGVSPDGILPTQNGMIEIKRPMMRTHLEYIESGKLPTEYRYQVQGQLFVTGFGFCDFVSSVDGMKPFIVRVYPDQELFLEFEKRLEKLIVDVNKKLENYNKYDYLQ
jgi:putative phage-type endonuclease